MKTAAVVLCLLIGEPSDSSDLLIPISGRHASGVAGGSEEASFLICSQRAHLHRRLRRGAALAAGLVLGSFRPY